MTQQTAWSAQVVASLQPLADPARSAGMHAYMRQRFAFFGIATPQRRHAVSALLRAAQPAGELLANAAALWQRPERECQYVAVDLLARQVARLGLADLPALFALVRARSWWDSVDGLAGVIGDIVRVARRADPQAVRTMDAALADDDFWVRHVALLHQLGWRGETDTGRLFGYALEQAGDGEFFIRKAIGWALRDYAWHDPAAVAAFLAGPGRQLAALSRREAGKHLARLGAA